MTEPALVVDSALALRAATEADNDQVAAIWNHEVRWTTSTTDTEPRTAEAQRDWLARHGDAYPAIVAVAGDEVLGYGSLSPYKPKPAFARTVENSVYVKSGHRGRGVGARLLAELLRLAVERDYHAVMARITAGNEASCQLHRRHGFELVGVERETAFKFGRWHDIVLMQRLPREE